LSDLSISSIDCATALSSSISKTRMSVPHSRQTGRQVGPQHLRHSKRLCSTDSDPDQSWLTKSDSDPQGLPVQFLSNRPKILRRSSFLYPCAFKSHVRRQAYLTPATRCSLGSSRATSVTKDSDAMINDAGKHQVKRRSQVRENLRFSQ